MIYLFIIRVLNIHPSGVRTNVSCLLLLRFFLPFFVVVVVVVVVVDVDFLSFVVSLFTVRRSLLMVFVAVFTTPAVH